MTQLTRPLPALSGGDLRLAGGKGASLGELARAGLPVPPGFVLTTEAYALAAASCGVNPDDPDAAGRRLAAAPVPEPVVAAATAAYRALGDARVAVRSSATAEDLPGASFAGQQDSYLDVEGDRNLLEAVRRCWASLWNQRAVAYRRARSLDDRDLRLAVVVQRLVQAEAAGVLFTADPVTGRRDRLVVDSVAGLGDALVCGAITPDHDIIDRATGALLDRRPAGPRPVLREEELSELGGLGERAERNFGAPQDIEFALDAERRIWIVQSRPITTLYPLPDTVSAYPAGLRAYWSISVFQGYLDPMTPMGMQLLRLLASGLWRLFGGDVGDPVLGPPEILEAGLRPYADLTAILRDPLGGAVARRMTAIGEARSSAVLARLADDPRLRPVRRPRARSLLLILGRLHRAGILAAALQVARSPETVPERYLRELDDLLRLQVPANTGAGPCLDAFQHLVLSGTPVLFRRMLGVMLPTMLSLASVHLLLGERASADDLHVLTRGGAHNPTLEMDLALWSLSTEVASDPECRSALLRRTPADLAAAYRRNALPGGLQACLSAFLDRFGFRAIGEIDAGVPRWAEDPAHLLGMLANYVQLGDAAAPPDVRFAGAVSDAEAMTAQLLSRVRGPRRLLLRAVLRRVRALAGYREAPKFQIIRLLVAPARRLLRDAGADLQARGLLDDAGDIFLLTLPEARRAAGGEDLRRLITARRAGLRRERGRRHIPRLLLSDGTDAEAELITASGDLAGTPASPGVVSGQARVVRRPEGAHLEPGEILVAPSTDPGWTPLFMTAGGLVMEIGGMMSHGAVVAREYGIPAVVGVPEATERIPNGASIIVDGGAGTITLEEPDSSADSLGTGAHLGSRLSGPPD